MGSASDLPPTRGDLLPGRPALGMGRLLLLGTRQAAVTEANDPPGPPSEFDPRGLLPKPPRFDVSNVIVGAVVTCLLVAALICRACCQGGVAGRHP